MFRIVLRRRINLSVVASLTRPKPGPVGMKSHGISCRTMGRMLMRCQCENNGAFIVHASLTAGHGVDLSSLSFEHRGSDG